MFLESGTNGHCYAGGRLAGQIVRALVHWAGVSLPVSLTSYSVVSITHQHNIRNLPLKVSRFDSLVCLFPTVLSSVVAIHACKGRPRDEHN